MTKIRMMGLHSIEDWGLGTSYRLPEVFERYPRVFGTRLQVLGTQ